MSLTPRVLDVVVVATEVGVPASSASIYLPPPPGPPGIYRRFLEGGSEAAAAAAAAALAARTALVVPGGRPRRRGAGEGDAMRVYIVLYMFPSFAKDGSRAAKGGADRGARELIRWRARGLRHQAWQG